MENASHHLQRVQQKEMAPHDLPHSVMSRQSNQNLQTAAALRHVRDLHRLVQRQQ